MRGCYGLGLLLLLVTLTELARGDPCEQYANGCSTPFHMPLPYKTLFTPSCFRHDVCYRCGAQYGISKATCDSAFLHGMQAACAANDAGRRRRHMASSGPQKRSVCTVMAQDVFYAAVHLIGGLFYRDAGETESYCTEAAARSCLP